MKLSKYIFLMPSAIEKVSKRFKVKPLSPSELFVLYSIQYLPPCSQQSLLRHASKCGHPISQPTLSLAVTYLQSVGLISYSGHVLSISPTGREYLSAIRLYLLNKRL